MLTAVARLHDHAGRRWPGSSRARLADWCVDRPRRGRRRAAPPGRRPRRPHARAPGPPLQARPVTGADLPEALAEALASGHAELMAEVTEDDRRRLVRGEEQERLVDGLGLRSAMLVPLVSRGHVRRDADARPRRRRALHRRPTWPRPRSSPTARRRRSTQPPVPARAQEAHARFAGLIDGLDAIVWEADPDTLELDVRQPSRREPARLSAAAVA